MTLEEALAIVEIYLKPDRLNALQELIFRQCWSGRTYQEIAEISGYDADYMRVVGSRLWLILSNAFGEKITKNNFHSVLRHYLKKWKKKKEEELLQLKTSALELPRGQVPLNSPFYIERPPTELICFEEILQPGALIRIKAPRQMGKTSLMARI